MSVETEEEYRLTFMGHVLVKSGVMNVGVVEAVANAALSLAYKEAHEKFCARIDKDLSHYAGKLAKQAFRAAVRRAVAGELAESSSGDDLRERVAQKS